MSETPGLNVGGSMGEVRTRTEENPADLRLANRRPSGPSADRAQLAASVAGWVFKAAGPSAVAVQVLVPDELGRLQMVAADGDRVAAGRLRSSRRRQVFVTKRSLSVALRDPAGCSLTLFPLMAGGEAVGVVEVIAPAETFDERRDVLEAVLAQSAAVFRGARERRESERTIREMEAMLELSAALLWAETPAAAVRSAVQVCFEHVRVPLVGLLPDRSGAGWFIAAARGLGAKRRAELRRSVEDVSASGRNRSTRARLSARFAEVAGRDRAEAIEAGDAVLLAADAQPGDRAFLRTAGSLLSESLAHLGAVGWAQMRNEHLDLALAWTAHELRGPLVGARAALGQVRIDGTGPESRELLRQTRDELKQLADLVDPLLRWSAGSSSLNKRQIDLVRIVRDTVTSCCREFAHAQVAVEAPDELTIRADAQQLRGAIGNVLRNALTHAPPGTPVRVSVETEDGIARVCVRDRGPGVPASERHLVFDPFARARVAHQARGGKGLGLFIARRVVEAHGGSIGMRPVRPGAEFCIDLPLLSGGRSRSES